jgi:hypothetical protein
VRAAAPLTTAISCLISMNKPHHQRFSNDKVSTLSTAAS